MGQKRVAAIHDISGFGKCSLTVALPIISAAGIETAVIPTAVLSTHTGGFTGYTFRDLTDDILPIAQHWASENISFDAIYSGYLGSKAQVQIVIRALEILKNNDTKIIVDPVMADHGKLYAGFSEDFPQEMLALCKKAHIIVPNITEACFLVGKEYKAPPYNMEYIEDLLKCLYSEVGVDIVLTGVCFDNNNLGAAVMSGGKINYCFAKKSDAVFHGTGDVFASALTAAVLKGKNLEQGTQIAVDFTRDCIERTLMDNADRRYGVNFENELCTLIKYLEQ
jgi:pyridoxine kinase